MQYRCRRHPHRYRLDFRHRDGSRHHARHGELGLESTHLGYSNDLAAHGAEVQPLFPNYVLAIVDIHQNLPAVVLSTTSRRWKGQLYGVQLGVHWSYGLCWTFLLSVHLYQYLPVLVGSLPTIVIEQN